MLINYFSIKNYKNIKQYLNNTLKHEIILNLYKREIDYLIMKINCTQLS